MDEHKLIEDPTVLEYLRYLLRGGSAVERQLVQAEDNIETEPAKENMSRFFFISVALFLLGQFLIESFRNALSLVAIGFFLLGVLFALVSKKQQESSQISFWSGDKIAVDSEYEFRWTWLFVGIVMGVGAFMIYQNGNMSFVSLLLWAGSIFSSVRAFWHRTKEKPKTNLPEMIRSFISDKPRLIFSLIVLLVVLYFQFMKLDSIPGEMISTQVETFLSVNAIRNGDWGLWFPRNVISEPLGYYWAAFVSSFFGSSLSYLTLKTFYALSGLIALFFTYKFAKLFFDETTGLIAALLMGVSFWAILQQRAVVGYGLVLAILVPAVYFLFKSLEEEEFNAFLVSSILTCLGIMTNKVFLVLPLFNLLVTMIYYRKKERENRLQVLIMRVGAELIVGVITLLPYLLMVISNLKDWAAPITNGFLLPEGSPNGLSIFLGNLLSGLWIFNWSNNSSWVDGLRNRSALDWVSAAFFLFGLVQMIVLTKKNKRYLMYSLLIGFFIFLVPSAMNLAFPAEHPALDKSLPLLLFAVLLTARGMSLSFQQFNLTDLAASKLYKLALASLVLIVVVFGNYRLITDLYAQQFSDSAWNTREIARVLDNFDEGQGYISQGYVVGYPHWVDARAVTIIRGKPDENLSVLYEDLDRTVALTIPKIFLLNPFDKEGISKLQSLYPQGVITTYQSANPNKNFVIYIAGQ